MKNTFSKIVFVVLAGFSFAGLSAFRASAAKQAIFPDSKNLQPLPAFVQANVSGNVNSKVSPAGTYAPAQTEAPTAAEQTDTAPKNFNYSIVWFALALFVLSAAIFWFIKKIIL